MREHNGVRLLLGLVGDCLVEVRVPLAAPCPSVTLFPARCVGCDIFPIPKYFWPHPSIPKSQYQDALVGLHLPWPHQGSGVGSGWRSSPAPLQTQPYWAGRTRTPSSLRVLPPLPAFIPGQAQQLPASSQPSRPAVLLQLHLCLSLHSLSGRWAPAWPGASLLPSMRHGWCGDGRLGPPHWRCWLRGECPYPVGLDSEQVGMSIDPSPVPSTQRKHLPAPLPDLPGQHQQEHQPVQH